MARRVELEIGVRNPEATESFFDRASRSIDRLGKSGKKAFSSINQEIGGLIKSGIGSAIAMEAAELLNAVTQGMRTTFSQAIDSAEKFRLITTQVALGTGRSFGETQHSVRESSNAIADTQQTVLSFSKSVQSSTGYWLEGSKAVDAYKDRALYLGKTLEEMSGEASSLTNLFDMRDGNRITSLFNTMNAQAEKLGIHAKTAALQFAQMAGTMARMTSANPEKLAAVSSTFLKAAGGNKEQATVIQQGVMNFLRTRLPYIEDEMRASGQIKKGESILGKDGRIREDLWIPIIKSQQAYIKKHFGKMSWREQMRILGQGDVFGSSEAAAGFLNLDSAALEQASGQKKPPVRSSLEKFLLSPAAKSIIEANKKEERDQDQVGSWGLKAKDWMTRHGGGWNGVLADAAIKGGAGAAAYTVGKKVLQKAVGRGALGAVEGAAARAAPKAVQTVASTAAKGGGLRLLAKGLGPIGSIAGFLLTPDELNAGEYEELKRYKEEAEAFDKYLKTLSPEDQKRTVESRHASGRLEFAMRPFRDYHEDHGNAWGRFWQWAGSVKEPKMETLDPKWEEDVKKLLPEDLESLANKFGDELVKKTLRVEIIPTSAPPPGEVNQP